MIRISLLTLLFCPLVANLGVAAESNETIEKRMSSVVQYLASDEMEGRGIGTKGIDKAADFIAAEFRKVGLNTNVFDGGPFQEFPMSMDARLGPDEKNHLTLIVKGKEGDEPNQITLKLGEEFNPLAIGGSNAFDLPVVFAGYGISSKEAKYDDFENVDVKGKAIIIIRKEPQQANPHSLLDGKRASRHALFSRKISNAYEHGAACVIMVNDQYGMAEAAKNGRTRWLETVAEIAEARDEYGKIKDPTDEQFSEHRTHVAKLAKTLESSSKIIDAGGDVVVPFQGGGRSGSHHKLPVFFVDKGMVAPLIKAATGKDFATIEKEIDKDLVPQSLLLTKVRVVGEASVKRTQVKVKNVVAVLEGEGPLADETIVVGAHYDHLGMGGPGTLAPWTVAVHNGADDNASGAAALLEVARNLAARDKPLPRRIVFIAFTGEERGLLGSAHYVKSPRYPLSKTVAMVNMDMVGRLKENKLIAHGTGTADGFDKIVDLANKTYEFKIVKKPGGYGPSDHQTFYSQKIPVFHFFTGTHSDYHRPSDDFEKINVVGMRRIAGLVEDVTLAIAELPKRPTYIATKAPVMNRGGSRPYFGSIPDFGEEVEGYAISGCSKGSPADKGGLKKGDVIVKLGKSRIGGLEDFDSALRKYKAGDVVEVVVKRSGKEVSLKVKLGSPR